MKPTNFCLVKVITNCYYQTYILLIYFKYYVDQRLIIKSFYRLFYFKDDRNKICKKTKNIEEWTTNVLEPDETTGATFFDESVSRLFEIYIVII